MKTLREYLQYHCKLPEIPGSYGIEIEVGVSDPLKYPPNFFCSLDGARLDHHKQLISFGNPHAPAVKLSDFKYWKFDLDQSVKDFGGEFVLSEPLDLSGIEEALSEFKKKTQGIPFYKDHASCSVHVHVNMAKETPKTLANFLTLWTLCENFLLYYCGDSRSSNLFALPTRVAEETCQNIIGLLRAFSQADIQGMKYHKDHVKYGALNIAPLLTFGSVEVRSMRGTTDTSVILNWVQMLQRLLDYSRQDCLPEDILYRYRKGRNFFRDVFGSYHYDIVPCPDPFGVTSPWFANEIAVSQDFSKLTDEMDKVLKKYEERPKKSPPISPSNSSWNVGQVVSYFTNPIYVEPATILNFGPAYFHPNALLNLFEGHLNNSNPVFDEFGNDVTETMFYGSKAKLQDLWAARGLWLKGLKEQEAVKPLPDEIINWTMAVPTDALAKALKIKKKHSYTEEI